MTLPKINHRVWLPLWAQQCRRRRHPRLLPAPVVWPQYPTLIVWEWNHPNPYQWRVYSSLDGGATWFFISDYWHYGDSRMFAPDGGSGLFFVVGVNTAGVEVTQRSNAVCPDDAPMPSTLLGGLQQFYVPQAGASFLQSWNETEAVGLTNPFAGLVTPYATGGGNYPAYEDLIYLILPYQDGANGRVYAGTMLRPIVSGGSVNINAVWPAWSASPGWVTGYTLLLYTDSTGYVHRDVNAASMFAGWTDDGTGWTAGTSPTYDDAPRTLKVLWSQLNDWWTSGPVPVDVTTSPLGGSAFDGTYGTSLTRGLSDELRRSVTGTMAFWVSCEMGSYEPVIAALRGVFSTNFQVAVSGDSLKGLNSFYAAMTDCQAGDWYLVVLRNDELLDTTRLDVARRRGGTWYAGEGVLSAAYETVPLMENSNYLEEGIWGVLTFGGSWHWGSYYPAMFDRMGVWDRPLTDPEVEQLFNSGLGWEPA